MSVLDQIRELDPNDPGRWPMPFRLGAIGLIFIIAVVLLGYLLLDYENAYRIEALGVYSARYAHLAIWPLAELLDVLAGGPVDLAQARADFRQVVLATPNPRRDLRERMQARPPRPTRSSRRRSRP